VYTRSSRFCWPTNSTDNASHAAVQFFSARDRALVNIADSNDDHALMATEVLSRNERRWESGREWCGLESHCNVIAYCKDGWMDCADCPQCRINRSSNCTPSSLFQCAAMLSHVIATAFLSVCPSFTRRYCVETNEHKMMPSSLTESRPLTLVFWLFKIRQHIRKWSPLAGTLNEIEIGHRGDVLTNK